MLISGNDLDSPHRHEHLRGRDDRLVDGCVVSHGGILLVRLPLIIQVEVRVERERHFFLLILIAALAVGRVRVARVLHARRSVRAGFGV